MENKINEALHVSKTFTRSLIYIAIAAVLSNTINIFSNINLGATMAAKT